MRFSQVLATIVALSSVSAASMLDEAKAVADHALIARQNDNKSSAAASNTKNSDASSTADAKSSAKESSSEPTKTDSNAKSTDDNSASGSQKATGKTTAKPSATNYGADTPNGGVSMVNPPPLSGAQYYKVGDWVTFAWNYTSLKAPPSAVDVLATCTANQATYTLAVNQSFTDSTILWDTGAYQTSASIPLLTEMYTLMIYDADSSISATAAPGHLAVQNNALAFGMYTPQPYTSWADFNCPNCIKSGALSANEALTLKILAITGGTTAASFLYFAYSFGII